ncbi:hypothetical protein O6H91_10G039900 [Diphasiastrum complanatum]|uniref:Uncharacterized protein n=2 Tax=Diphasiastrum complanatum TaxID=34168 RepID=A0ACC2CG91_DIPCM|nr:hypothetical protein O6H91_10G039900 [Diphasiastrum complanatum]KAJ7540991.1 hypothetical protein O6H91_10G039900 [Diphasiastrum complanatum]
MLSRNSSMRIRGRNDTVQSRRLVVLVCGTVLMLALLSLYYGSFFGNRFRHAHDSVPHEDKAGWAQEKHIQKVHNKVRNQDESDPSTKLLDNESVSAIKHRATEDDNVENTSEKDDKPEGDQEKTEKEGNDDKENDDSEVDDIKGEEGINEVTLKTFPVCDARYTEIIPCLDRQMLYDLKIKLNHTLMEHYERHCPPQQRRLNCLIPPPPNYKVPIRWPISRDQVWRANVPHTFLAVEKSDQHWMVIKGERVSFPGGGTHFHDGADKYIAALGKMLKNPNGDLSGKGKIRTVLDVGCGVASFGAYLLPLNILAMSIAPNDVHENQIQFALERGIPSTLGVLGTKRLPYPSKSFELAHCSRCRIDWAQRNGILLLELDRLLRPGGYFAWSSPPAYKDDDEDRQIWNDMDSLTKSMCWSIAAKEGQTVIWMKPLTNDCYNQRPEGASPPLCDVADDPDAVWQVPMKACITPIAEYNNFGKGNGLMPWPKRLNFPPPRLQELHINANTFQRDTTVWRHRVELYWKLLESQVQEDSIRNVMDMKAHFGGFAAALKEKPVWVMNVVPSTNANTLKIVYDRGLIGTSHDWCEAFSTYPRTFDLIHAWTIFSDIEERGCSLEDLLLEIDRILRPMGIVIIRDKPSVISQIRRYLPALHWDKWSKEVAAELDEGTHSEEKILLARKQLWQPDDSL